MPGASTKQYIGVNKIRKGGGLIKDLYKGSTPAKMAYKGSNLIFDRRTLVIGTTSNLYSSLVPAAGSGSFDVSTRYTIFSYINNGVGTNIGNNAWSTSTSVQSHYASIPANTSTSARMYPITVYTGATDPFGTLQICSYILPFAQAGVSISVDWTGQINVYWGCWSDGVTFTVHNGSTYYTITSVTWTGQPSYIDSRHPSTATVNFTIKSQPSGASYPNSVQSYFDITFTIKATVNGSTQTFTKTVTFSWNYVFPLRFRLQSNGVADAALSDGAVVFVTSGSNSSSPYYYVLGWPDQPAGAGSGGFSTYAAINSGWNYVNTTLYTNNSQSIKWNNQFNLYADTTIWIPVGLTVSNPALFFGFNSEYQTISNVTIVDSGANTYTPIKLFNYSGKDYVGFSLSVNSGYYTNHFSNPYTRASVKNFSEVDYYLTFS